MRERVLSFIQQQSLLKPGDRLGVAVSGGADSVALLRLMLELRTELGIVVSVVHFNHKIRGADADADEQFVAALAAEHGLELHRASADVPQFASRHKLSLEAAGRRLRYEFLFRLMADGKCDKVATAHTLDDQAETALLRLLRGAGTKGLAGIHPQWSAPGGKGSVIRPLLSARRNHLRQYLERIGQAWREDASNANLTHLRNRVRHKLLPLLQQEFNPAIAEVLADVAKVARDEEDYWTKVVHEHWPALRAKSPSNAEEAWSVQALRQLPVALQRRLLRALGEKQGVKLDLHHVERVLALLEGPQTVASKEVELPKGHAIVLQKGELRWQQRGQNTVGSGVSAGGGYEHRVTVPGEVRIPEVGSRLRVTLVPPGPERGAYNTDQLLDARLLASELLVRNWRPGDRFRPAHTQSPKKIKELLQERHLLREEKALWPVVVSGGQIVWVRGFCCAADCLATAESTAVAVVEEVNSTVEQSAP